MQKYENSNLYNNYALKLEPHWNRLQLTDCYFFLIAIINLQQLGFA